jgi:pyruvate dehydrogenase E2 component (dihydrolipoamide acetyltransferase)
MEAVVAPMAAPVPPAAPAPVATTTSAVLMPGGKEEVIKLSKIRKLTGDHMVRSLSTTPHAFSVVEVDFANVDSARNSVKAAWKTNEGFSLTYLPFVTRAVVDALTEFPQRNRQRRRLDRAPLCRCRHRCRPQLSGSAGAGRAWR